MILLDAGKQVGLGVFLHTLPAEQTDSVASRGKLR
jgi:hypothetical protein